MGSGTKYYLPKAFYIHFDGIDDEHEHLVEIVNGLLDTTGEDGWTVSAPQLATFVQAMESHFHHEERYMEDLEYPGLEWHRNHHAECLQRAKDILAESERRGGVDSELAERCFVEVIHEIARGDLKFGEFVEGRNLDDGKD